MKKSIILLTILTNLLFAEIVWLKEAPKRMNWKDAMQYCKDMNAILPSKKSFSRIMV